MPVLRELELPAAVFLATGPIGTDRTLWPDRLWLAIARGPELEIDLTAWVLGIRPLKSNTDRGAAYTVVVEKLKNLPAPQRIAALDEILCALGHHGDGGPFLMLSWEQARQLAADPLVMLYPHTVTHPILARCDDAKLHREITESCTAIERETGSPPTVFFYPNGRLQDFDERTKDVLRARGVRWALPTAPGFADRCCDPLALPRLAVAATRR